jgi:ADP-heptose:LPS heptosyltransferase
MKKNIFKRRFARITRNFKKICGRFTGVFHKKQKVPVPKTILVNRVDRIGDAVMSKPFLDALSKRFDVTVLCSKYNEFALTDFKRIVLEVTEYDSPLDNFLKRAVKYVKELLFTKTSKSIEPQYDLFLDLIGGFELIKWAQQNRIAKHIISCNAGLYNVSLDYWSDLFFMSIDNVMLIDRYISLLEGATGVKLNVSDTFDIPQQPVEFSIDEPFIVIFVGGKPNRLISGEKWAKIIDALSVNKILLIGDNDRANFDAIINGVVNKNNIITLDKIYNLPQLSFIIEKASLLIGLDGGGTHYLQNKCNSITIYTTGSYNLWKPFSKNPYILTDSSIGKTFVESTTTSGGKIKSIAYRANNCRPCYGIGCGKCNCINKFDENAVIAEAKRIINIKSNK